MTSKTPCTHPNPSYTLLVEPRDLSLQEVAADVQAPLQIAPAFDQFSLPASGAWQLGLAGTHQRVNASLAVQLAATWEQAVGHSCGRAGSQATQRADHVQQLQLPDVYAAGLKDCVWPGRAQVRCCFSVWLCLYGFIQCL